MGLYEMQQQQDSLKLCLPWMLHPYIKQFSSCLKGTEGLKRRRKEVQNIVFQHDLSPEIIKF